jgi:hypothetical protein
LFVFGRRIFTSWQQPKKQKTKNRKKEGGGKSGGANDTKDFNFEKK